MSGLRRDQMGTHSDSTPTWSWREDVRHRSCPKPGLEVGSSVEEVIDGRRVTEATPVVDGTPVGPRQSQVTPEFARDDSCGRKDEGSEGHRTLSRSDLV